MKSKIFAMILILMFVFTGCKSNGNDRTEDDVMSVDREITKRETELLSENFPYDMEEIKSGELDSAEKVALKNLRLATDLVNRKYPDLDYKIVSFVASTKLNTRAVLNIKIGEDDKEYKAYVVYDENDKPEASETVYGSVIRKPYDDYICRLLEANGIYAKAFTNFETPVKDEVNKDTTPEEIIEMEPRIVRYTDIFVSDTEDQQMTADAIKSVMDSNNIYAVYEINFVDEPADKDVKELEAERKNYRSVTFECAD